LHAAIQAIEQKDIERKGQALKRAGIFIANLRNILDFESGGDTALYLDRFYALATAKIVEGSFKLSTKTLRDLAQEFAAVRDAWQAQGVVPAVAESPSSNPHSSGYPGITDSFTPENHGWNA
ncbi:MAG: flagellar protein FliS, partial [Terriglobia bacterium]